MKIFIRTLGLNLFLLGACIYGIGQTNTSFGPGAGNPIGTGNTTAGYNSGEFTQNVPMNHITFLGYISGRNNRGSYNTFLGSRAGELNTTGDNNIFIGYATGHENRTGKENVYIGTRTAEKSNSGDQNTYIGNLAGFSNTSGSYNFFGGFSAGQNSQGGLFNVLLGHSTGLYNEGDFNVFLGTVAGRNNTTGKENTFVGGRTGYENVSGSRNLMFGFNAGRYNTGGNTNIFMGYASGLHSDGGDHNIFLGDSTGLHNLGRQNIFLGSRSGMSNEAGHNNVFIGTHSGIENTLGTYNTFLGNYAGFGNFNGAQNTFLGYAAGYTNQAGRCNVFVGHYAGYGNIYGKYNTFMGYGAGSANTNGDQNVFIGDSAASANTTGKHNVVIGSGAGKVNQVGEKNVFLGFQAGATETGSNALHIANNSTSTLIYGDFASGKVGINTTAPTEALHVNGNVLATASFITSDRRFKKDIQKLEKPLDKIIQVEGVSYNLKSSLIARNSSEKLSNTPRYGFIAQDLKEVFPEMVIEGENGYLAVNYDAMIPVLVEAMKDLRKENQELRAEITERDHYLEVLDSRLGELEIQVGIEDNRMGSTSSLDVPKGNQLGAIYPNPSSSNLNIPYTLLSTTQTARISLQSLDGKELLNKALPIQAQGLEHFSITNLTPGTYLATLLINGKKADVTKVVVK